MPQLHRANLPVLTAVLVALGTGACAQSQPDVGAVPTPAQIAGCLEAGDGSLQADLRGVMEADLSWKNGEMQCEGGMRPDGKGIRITIAGPLPAPLAPPAAVSDSQAALRFIFGIDLQDTASGAVQALPTNLTVIVEGGQLLYATRGDDKCAVETLDRSPLAGHAKLERVSVRGYCTGPASDLAGTSRLFVPTFTFTALLNTGGDP
jgi:hypothetical protein